MGRDVDEREALALGLAAGVLCQIVPGLTAGLLAIGVAALHLRSEAPPLAHLRTLLSLAAITAAGLLGGPDWLLIAALTWRVGAEVARTGRAGLLLAHAAAPAAALLYRVGAPGVLTLAAVCVALVICMERAIEHLAAWRLGTPVSLRFAATQATIVAPLLILPSVAACLAALVAMALVRAAPVPQRLTYAAA